MKMYFYVFGFVFISSRAEAVITFVQFSSSSANAAQVVTTWTVTTGDLIVCCNTRGNNESLTYSDDSSNIYTKVFDHVNWDAGSGDYATAVYVIYSTGAVPLHTKVVGSGNHQTEMHCDEYAWNTATGTFDVSASSIGVQGGDVFTSSPTLAVAKELNFACGFSGNSITGTNGFTDRDEGNGNLTMDKLETTSGLHAASANEAGATPQNFGLFQMAFKPSPSNIVVVQSTTTVGNGTSKALAFPSNVTAGDMVVAICGTGGSGAGFSTPTDTIGGSYSLVVSSKPPSNGAIFMWQKANVPGGADTVTCTVTGTGDDIHIALYEISGTSYNPGDQIGGSLGAAPNLTVTTNGATTTANEVVIAGFYDNSGNHTFTVGSGYYQLLQTITGGGDSMATELRIVTVTGSQTATMTETGSVATNPGIVGTFTQATQPSFRGLVIQ